MTADMIDIKVPPLGESITQATIARWYKKAGDGVQENDLLLELETDKVTLEVNAPTSGVLQSITQNEGAAVSIGDIVGVLDSSQSASANTSKTSPAAAHTPEPAAAPISSPIPTSVEPKMSPAAEHHITLNPSATPPEHGSGHNGMIMKSDVLHAAPARPTVAPSAAAHVSVESSSDMTRRPMSALRKKIAERLKYAQNTAAILTTFNECDMSTIMHLRKTHQDEFVKAYGTKLGFMSFFVKACVSALKKYPAVNSMIEGDEIIEHHNYNIGVAVSAPQGLIVPVLKHVDQMELFEIEQAIAGFSQKAKDNKLGLSDMTGGTFTISNGGTFGSLCSTPILNPPQSGILGMHKIQERPVVVDGAIVIRPMMYLALSYDHRMIDGREAVSFLVHIKNTIENPVRSLMGL